MWTPLQAALAAAQQGGGSYVKSQSSATVPQVPQPPVSAGLGLDLSSLRLQTSSPTPLPQRVRLPIAMHSLSEKAFLHSACLPQSLAVL